MYYNPILSDEKCISLVYKILNKNDTARVPDTEHIRNMIKRQATLLQSVVNLTIEHYLRRKRNVR